MTDDALNMRKARARTEALARSAQADPAASAALAAAVLADCPPPPGAIVSGFWPIGDEIDVRPLMAALADLGHDLCLPETPKRGLPLIFRRWRPGDTLVRGRFATSHPTGQIVAPHFMLVPLLAFDRSGNRLGYGAGYFDRTLTGLPGAFRLGCAFAAQEIETVPAGIFDQRLDAIATEHGVIQSRPEPKKATGAAAGPR